MKAAVEDFGFARLALELSAEKSFERLALLSRISITPSVFSMIGNAHLPLTEVFVRQLPILPQHVCESNI